MGGTEKSYEDYCVEDFIKDLEAGDRYFSDKNFTFQLERIRERYPIIPKLEFSHCNFTVRVLFDFSKCDEFYFSNCTFKFYILFSESTINTIHFDHCIFKRHVDIYDSKIKRFSLFDCKFHEPISLQRCSFSEEIYLCQLEYPEFEINTVEFKKSCILKRHNTTSCLRIFEIKSPKPVVLEKLELDKFSFTPSQVDIFRLHGIDWPTVAAVKKHKKVNEAMCRAWKLKARELGDEWTASNWHLLEKEFTLERLSKANNHVSYFFLRTYGVLSCFGESPERAFTILCSLMIFPLLFTFLHQFPKVAWTESQLSYALGYIPLLSKAALASVVSSLSVVEKCSQIIWQSIITIQASLLALAVRNKLRR